MIELFTRDLRLIVLSICSILVGGGVSFFILPRMEDPVLTERVAMVVTRAPGATSNRIESLITEKIVREIRTFKEVKEVQSTSRASVSTVVVTLADSIYDVDEVWAKVRDKLNSLKGSLPEDALNPELDVIKVRAHASLVGLVWKEESAPIFSIFRRNADELSDRIRSISNTEDVKLFGEPEEEIEVELNRADVARMNLTVDDIGAQIRSHDSKVPAGFVRNERSDLLIEIGKALSSLESILNVPIESKATGQTCFLRDVAMVRKGIASPARSEAMVDGRRAIIIASSVAPNARIDKWNAEYQQTLSQFRSELPKDMELVEIFNQTKYVNQRIHGLISDLLLSAVSVYVVVFLMMGWRSSLVVGAALPLSTCLVIFGLWLMKIPLHQMSLSGLVISLGMLEGTAIIIVDEIQRRLANGEKRLEAVSNGVRHMALPLFGSTSTTVLSFLPIAIMPGSSGEFVGTIGVSVILGLISSLVLSLTIIPVLASLATPQHSSSPWFINSGVSSVWLASLYRKTVRWAISHPSQTFVLGIILAIPGFVMVVFLPVQFFPSADREQLRIELELSPQASLDETKEVALQVRELLLSHSEIRSVDWVLGRNAPSFYYNMIGTRTDSSNFAEAIINIDTRESIPKLVRRLQAELNQSITKAQTRLLQLEQGPPYIAPIEIRVLGENSDSLREYGERLRVLLQSYPNVIQTQADLTDFAAKLVYDVKDVELKQSGLSSVSVSRQLLSNLEGTLGGTVIEGNVEIPIRVRLGANKRDELSSIENIDFLASYEGIARNTTNLSSIANSRLDAEPAAIARFNNKKVNLVSAYLTAGILPSTVFSQIEQDLRKPEFAPPTGCSIEFGGENSKRTEAVEQLVANASFLVVGTVFVLVFSLKSFRAMLVIVGIGGLSFGMAICCLGVTGYPFGFTAIVGAMGMVGIAINDSIVVLSELRTDPNCSRGDKDSVLEMIMRCTRHVLCTTFTVGCSFLPMLIDGGTFWPPMAMVISGGVFGATWLALYWIPAVHILIQGRSGKLQPQ